MYKAEICTRRKVDQKHLEGFEMLLKKDGDDQLDRLCEK
jgi:hypothetical protein